MPSATVGLPGFAARILPGSLLLGMGPLFEIAVYFPGLYAPLWIRRFVAILRESSSTAGPPTALCYASPHAALLLDNNSARGPRLQLAR